MKRIVVKVSKNEAKVLIDLCKDNGYKTINDWHKGVYWFVIKHEPKEYSLWLENPVLINIHKLDFYKDMDKIVESFKPEFKVGDWVKLPNKKTFGWNSVGLMDKFLGMVVKITWTNSHSFKFNGYDSYNFLLNEILRHATESEIAIAKGDDIMVGEHKVEFTDGGIKVGCRTFDKELLDYLFNWAKFIRKRQETGMMFDIGKDGSVEVDGVSCPYKTLKKIYKKLK